MKISRHLLAVFAAVTILGAQASADELNFVEDIPTDILFGTVAANGEPSESPAGGASSQSTFGSRNADAAGQEGTRTRGQSFTFATGDGLTHDIGSLSVSLNNPLNNTGFRPDGQLELTIFEWDTNDPDNFANWDAGTGGEFTSGHTELYRESFPLLSADFPATPSSMLVQIAFDAGSLQLTDGTSYGFLFRYTLDSLVDDDGNPLTSDITFAFDTRNDNMVAGSDPVVPFPGALLNTNTADSFAVADNGQSTPRDMNFFFTSPDTAVLLGDVDLSTQVDFLDIAPFIALLSQAGAFQAEADINGDNAVTFLDIAPFITILAGG